ncbi:MAG TPA: hypothetical protein VGE97_04095, partial [Nitrososphaera sp.]
MSTTITEYVCPDCGTLLRHSNPTTLESMRDVHNQLCLVKRQKSMAAQVAVPKPAAASATPAVAAPSASSAAPRPAIAAEVSGSVTASGGTGGLSGGGPTTISLTGSGTSYDKVEGPIDPKFKEKRQAAGSYQGI